MPANTTIPLDRLRADIDAGTIDTVLTVFADHQGRLVGKRTNAAFFLDDVVAHGTENCDYLLACDLDDTPLPGFRWASYDTGYGDMRGVVDTSTIRHLPWLERTAIVLLDLVAVGTGEPVEVAPRRMLQRQVDAAAGQGLVVKCGTEIEFFTFADSYDAANGAGYRDLSPTSPYLEDYQILQTSKEERLIGSMRRQLAAAGFPVEHSKGEAGRGQHEINLTFQTALETADLGALFKHAVKEIAALHDRSATFMAKPHAGDAGSSFHVHTSLWSPDGASSLVAGDGAHGLSDRFRWFLGGLVATAAELLLLRAPTVNSYKRFVAGSWAPTAVAWGTDNRTLGFRLVGGGASLRIEDRIPGADANPYHVLAATIAGGLHGVAERIEPPPPYSGNGYAAEELERIPTTFAQAIERWRHSEVARARFGGDVHHHVLHHAECELAAFEREVTDWERRRYFERI